MAMGTTSGCIRASTTVMPSTADSTDMAGVMMASPKNSAVAITPSSTSCAERVSPGDRREMRAIRARLPPSPRLSARMMTETYFSVTTSIIVQKIKEMTP